MQYPGEENIHAKQEIQGVQPAYDTSVGMNNINSEELILELKQMMIKTSKQNEFLKKAIFVNIFVVFCIVVLSLSGMFYVKTTIDNTGYVTNHAKTWFEMYEQAWKSSIPEDLRSFLRQDYASMFDHISRFSKSANRQLETGFGPNEVTSLIDLISSISDVAETMKMMNQIESANGHEVHGPVPEFLHWSSEWLIEQIKIEHWTGLASDCMIFANNARNVDWHGYFKAVDCPEPTEGEEECFNEEENMIECDHQECSFKNEEWNYNQIVDDVGGLAYDVCKSISKMTEY
jgi:hypothetical protein